MIKLYECINNLYTIFDDKLNDINSKHPCYQDFLYVKNYPHDDKYIEVLQKMPQPTELIIGSVGEYLWGKIQNNYGQLNSYCSPSYVNSHGQLSKDCKFQIWIEYDNQFKKINNSDNSHAYIIFNNNVDDNYYISSKNVQMMKNNGVYTFDLLKSKLRKYYFVEKNLNIDHFIYKEKIIIKENKQQFNQILIIIFIIILLVVLKCVI